MTDRQVGVITWYDHDKGYGFIRRHCGDDVLFHANAVAEVTNPARGQQVSFSLQFNGDTLRALDISAL